MSTFAVRRSLIAPEALAQPICMHYALNQPVTCQLLAHSHDDLYNVETGSGRFVCRVFAVENGRGDVAAQAMILEKMIMAGLPVSHPIAGDRGYVLDVPAPEGMRYGLLYAHSPGATAGQRITPEQASTYGQLVASVHELADAQSLTGPLQIDLGYLLDEPARIIRPLIAHRPRDLHWLEQSIEDLKRAVCDLPLAQPMYGLCHGDLHKSNILSQPQGELTLIDWDCVGMGWRAYDLSILRWSIGPAVGKEGIGEPRLGEVWRAYLDSYQRVRPLSSEELAAIPYFVAIRHIRALGWGVDRAVNGIDGVGLLTDGYFDWWFDGLRAWQEHGAA